MGFGSYDEDDENQGSDAGDIETGEDDRDDHEGSVEFETEETTEELVERLQGMKADDEDED